MTCWEGESAASTSSPMAFSLTASMSCLTTLKLTSASSSATRISRRATSMFSAESLPSPRRFLKTRCSLSDKLSNMAGSRYLGFGEDKRPAFRAVIHIIRQSELLLLARDSYRTAPLHCVKTAHHERFCKVVFVEDKGLVSILNR